MLTPEAIAETARLTAAAHRLAAAMPGGRCHLWDPRGEVAA